MKILIAAAVLLSGFVFTADADAWHRGGRAIVINAGASQVFVGRGFRRPSVVVNSFGVGRAFGFQPFFRQPALFFPQQRFVQRSFAQPAFFGGGFGSQAVIVNQGVGRCGSFFGY